MSSGKQVVLTFLLLISLLSLSTSYQIQSQNRDAQSEALEEEILRSKRKNVKDSEQFGAQVRLLPILPGSFRDKLKLIPSKVVDFITDSLPVPPEVIVTPVPPSRYLQKIDFIVSDNSVSDNSEGFIPQDLNQGAKGKYIYIMKTWTNNPNDAITAIQIITYKPAVTKTVAGMTITLVSEKGTKNCPGGFTRLNQDLNQGAGGAFIYICIQKGGSQKIEDIKIMAFDIPRVFSLQQISMSAIFQNGMSWKFMNTDLNQGTTKRGKYIYMFYGTR